MNKLKLVLAMFILFHANQGFAAPQDGKRSGGAEVQINICSEPRQIISTLKLVRKESKTLDTWYFDTDGRDLFRRGVRFRLRSSDRKSELTLKVGNQECGQVKPELPTSDLAKCEYDVHGGHPAGAVSITSMLDDRQTRSLLEGKSTLADVLSTPQIRYLQGAANVWPLHPV